MNQAPNDSLVKRRRIGKVEIVCLNDGLLQLPLGNFPSAQEARAQQLANRAAFPPDSVLVPVNAFVVRTPGRTWLLDAGAGSWFSNEVGRLPAAIELAGLKPDDIDVLLMTHLHIDHVGGLVADGRALFPRAEMWLAEEELDYWGQPSFPEAAPQRQQRSATTAAAAIAAYKGRTKAFKAETRIAEEILSVPLFGHTPGHTGFQVEDGGEALFVWGDIVHCAALQFAEPDWFYGGDVDHEHGVETRRAIFRRAHDERMLIGGMHLPFPGIGRVVTKDAEYAFQPEPPCEGACGGPAEPSQ